MRLILLNQGSQHLLEEVGYFLDSERTCSGRSHRDCSSLKSYRHSHCTEIRLKWLGFSCLGLMLLLRCAGSDVRSLVQAFVRSVRGSVERRWKAATKCKCNIRRALLGLYYYAKRGLAIACRTCLCLCDVGGSYPHRLKSWKLIARTISPSFLFVAQRSSTYSQGNMEKFGEEMFVQHIAYVHNAWLNRVNQVTRSYVVSLFTFVSTSRGHPCNSTAFLFK